MHFISATFYKTLPPTYFPSKLGTIFHTNYLLPILKAISDKFQSWLYRVVLLNSVRPDLWKLLSFQNWLFWQKSGLFCLQISANIDIFAQRWVLLSTVCPDSFGSIAPIARKNSHKLILLLLDYVVSLNRARHLGTVMIPILYYTT